MLKKLPGVFVAGEMIDWEAPTGGYLLQASFATGAAAGRGAAAWIERQARTGYARAVFRSTHRGRHRERSVAIQGSTRLPIALAALATSARALDGQ